MIASILYVSQSLPMRESTFAVDQTQILQIVLVKIVVLLVLFICPFLLREETLCLISTPLVAIEFWASRNFGRKFLQAEWHVDTSTEEDIWVYEAQLSAPAGFEAVFWYSFVLYGAALVASMLMSLKDGRLSLLCVQITAFVANYIHFFAYSTIIRLRNEGVFQQIAKEALGQESVINVKESVRLPLVYRSNRDNLNIIVVDARQELRAEAVDDS